MRIRARRSKSEHDKPIKEQTTDQNPTYSWIRTELAKAKSDYSALQARAAATQTIVTLYQGQAKTLEEKGLIQQDLLRTAKTNEENYLLYQRKQEEARMAEALDVRRILNVAIAERPNVPLVPTNSQLLFAMVGTSVIGDGESGRSLRRGIHGQFVPHAVRSRVGAEYSGAGVGPAPIQCAGKVWPQRVEREWLESGHRTSRS